MTLQQGMTVWSEEHPVSVGTVVREMENGAVTIQFVTAPSKSLPYGHIITEYWPREDWGGLHVVEAQ